MLIFFKHCNVQVRITRVYRFLLDNGVKAEIRLTKITLQRSTQLCLQIWRTVSVNTDVTGTATVRLNMQVFLRKFLQFTHWNSSTSYNDVLGSFRPGFDIVQSVSRTLTGTCATGHTTFYTKAKNSSSPNQSRHSMLTLTPLTWRIWWAPNNASKWQMGFNLAFKGLTTAEE